MPRVVHFEFAADDPERAVRFWSEAFGWHVKHWEGPQDYWLVTTGGEGEVGIDGGIMRRSDFSESSTGAIVTLDVRSVDEATSGVERAGGTIVVPKMAIPGVGWLAYCKDTEGTIFGVMESDESAGPEGEAA